jgi:hypothetical protein
MPTRATARGTNFGTALRAIVAPPTIPAENGSSASPPLNGRNPSTCCRYNPHDLRHRYASVQTGSGVPVTKVAAQLGHSRKSLTLDTYAHVMIAD